MGKSFGALATVACSTKRPPPITGGKRGPATTYLTDLACTPLDPVDAEVRQTFQLDTAHELLQTFVTGDPDVRQGDVLVVGGKDYPIKAAAEWAWRDTVTVHLILEDPKT